MKVIQIPENDPMTHERCAHCDRLIRAGQWVLHCMKYDGSYTKRNMLAHVNCVRTLLDWIPDDRLIDAVATRQSLLEMQESL